MLSPKLGKDRREGPQGIQEARSSSFRLHAKEHDKAFRKENDSAYNRMIREFTISYCDRDGSIEWPKLVHFVSGNLDRK